MSRFQEYLEAGKKTPKEIKETADHAKKVLKKMAKQKAESRKQRKLEEKSDKTKLSPEDKKNIKKYINDLKGQLEGRDEFELKPEYDRIYPGLRKKYNVDFKDSKENSVFDAEDKMFDRIK